MNILRHLSIFFRQFKIKTIEAILRHRIHYHNPTIISHHTVIWNYEYRHLDSIEIGRDVTIMPHAEIVVYKYNKHSKVKGKLVLKDKAVICTCVNIRAAGGVVILGKYSGIAENSVVVAANHSLRPGTLHLNTEWDEKRTGVVLGDNVWVGANCTLLPGCRIGDNSVIAAGSVVNKEVPANQIWGGVPARKIRDILS